MESKFIDYYAVLQVSPACDTRVLAAAYRALSKAYHPDNIESADTEKFSEVLAAYRFLSDPDQRAEYDLKHGSRKPRSYTFSIDETAGHGDHPAVTDAEIHEEILLRLYRQRRERALEPGVIGYLLQESLNCPDEQFEFHVWYLKSKGFIDLTEQGSLAITIEGVDHVIANRRAELSTKLIADRPESQHHAASGNGFG